MEFYQNKFNLLHICSDYSKQTLYKNLILSLNENNKNLNQSIYVPIRTLEEKNKFNIKDRDRINLKYDYILNKWDRIFFSRKINKIFQKITQLYKINKFNLVHAHFLFSDGSVALKLYKKYKLPYVVSIRNTDINIFFKYAKHLKSN